VSISRKAVPTACVAAQLAAGVTGARPLAALLAGECAELALAAETPARSRYNR